MYTAKKLYKVTGAELMALKASGIEDYPGRPPTHYSLSGLLAGIVSKKCFLVVWFHLSGSRSIRIGGSMLKLHNKLKLVSRRAIFQETSLGGNEISEFSFERTDQPEEVLLHLRRRIPRVLK